ncbi:MAG: tetratricopeptide repeat protein, partial [Spirochaetales bacterium]
MDRHETDDVITRTLALGSQGRFDEAAAALETQDDSLPGTKACSACLEAVRKLASGEHEEGIQTILPAVRELEDLGYSGSLGWAYSAAGFSFGILGDPALGIDWMEKALAIAERTGNKVQLRRCHNDKASLLAMMDDYERAQEFYERALAIDPATISDLERGGILNNLAYSCIHNARRGDISHRESIGLAEKALGYANAALALIRNPENSRFCGWVHYNRGSALTMLGDYATALAELELALDCSGDLSNLRMEVLIS